MGDISSLEREFRTSSSTSGHVPGQAEKSSNRRGDPITLFQVARPGNTLVFTAAGRRKQGLTEMLLYRSKQPSGAKPSCAQTTALNAAKEVFRKLSQAMAGLFDKFLKA